jgi:hypothetical protein
MIVETPAISSMFAMLALVEVLHLCPTASHIRHLPARFEEG